MNTVTVCQGIPVCKVLPQFQRNLLCMSVFHVVIIPSVPTSMHCKDLQFFTYYRISDLLCISLNAFNVTVIWLAPPSWEVVGGLVR